MKTVKASELSNLKMTTGNEEKYSIVIDNGIIKEWVGIGWVDIGKASKKDYETLPVVKRGKDGIK
jgi:hypothetical protein